ncbi:hypothetical protein HHK36_006872 [Tetracentron sinense]|uniref:Glycosyltransferase n=1 Tax=Tetracentron sinense TaxID=13715 RepID=A0A834ZSH9_TETSI|nr:hypothetical protein HHK36_006872 [Tetracentron sinense]
MMYDTIFLKSFSRYERKKLGYGALLGCLIITLSLFTVLKPYWGPLPILNLQLSMSTGLTMLMVQDTSSSVGLVEESETKEEIKPLCNVLEPRSDFCEIKGDIRIHGNSSTIFVASSQMGIPARNETWSIRPYARKGDETAMGQVTKLSVKLLLGHEEAPHCTINHSIPAIVFSLGGYAGNHFHDFSDVVIPLFLTSRQFHGEVQFLLTDTKSVWITKFQIILKQLSHSEIINIDRDNKIHCFPGVVVGLKHHNEIRIDPSKSPKGYSMKGFRQFLMSSYSLKREKAIRIEEGVNNKPRLLIISRRKTRKLTNEAEIGEMARSLGYELVVAEADAKTDLQKFARIVNSCDVMIGVHGAGLTNIVFLPENAILIQIVPLGGLEWLSRFDYGEPAVDMNLRYLEYMIKEEESSLIQEYPPDHAVIRDPSILQKQGWGAVKAVYMDKQNVKLDVGRMKLNIDGTTKCNHGHAGGGGVIRDHMGDFIAVFYKFYGMASNSFAEIRDLLDRLKLCVNLMNFVNMEIELDSLLVLSMRTGLVQDTSSSARLVEESETKEEIKPLCTVLEPRSDFCEIKGDIRIHGNSSTIFVASSQMGIPARNETWSIRPYARKGDETAMGKVTKLSVKLVVGHEEAPHCTINHGIPAIVFSLGGYAGNHFHDFSDVVIPLFLTSRQFHGKVQFLLTDSSSCWITKFQIILKQLSHYAIINIDRDNKIHCFPGVVVGLKHHKEFRIDPSKSPNGYSMKGFRQFLRSSYSLKRETAIRIEEHVLDKPRLLIISRRKTRLLTNEAEIAEMARSLGYEVVVAEANIMTDLQKFAHIVNSCDVMIGVHGAGLTNIVFLPENAIVIQIVPLGGLEWLARFDFGEPAVDMNIKYLEYMIKEGESSLIQEYPPDHAVIRDPSIIQKQGWGEVRSVYLDKQNVKLDVDTWSMIKEGESSLTQEYPLDHAVIRDPYTFHKQGWGAVSSVYLDKQNVKLDVGRFRATLLEALDLLLH